MSEKEIAIDLGTTNCVMAHRIESGVIEIIPNLDGQLKTESLVSWASGKPLVGQAAEPDLVLAPKYVARAYKRQMGNRADDNKPLAIITDPSGKDRTAVENSAAALGDLKKSAEKFLGVKVDHVTISFPAYFGDHAREDTKAAAKIAGFREVRLIEEPVAAALYYGLEKGRQENIVVIDFGGGTLDATFLQLSGDGKAKAKFTTGSCELGGTNYTESVMRYMCEAAVKENIVIDSTKDLACFYQNFEKARQGKEMLSRREKVILMPEAKGKRTTVELNREILREIASEFDQQFVDCCRKLAEKVASAGEKIDRVLAVGGSSRLPHVKDMIKDVFNLEVSTDTDPDVVIAKGAAIWSDVCFGGPEREILVGGHKYLSSDISVSTVSAHAICVAVRKPDKGEEEYNDALIAADTELPCQFTQRYAPRHPGQRMVVVKLVQGKPEELSDKSKLIREIKVPIEPSQEDSARIVVKGQYSEEGILSITVLDELLGKPVDDSFVYKTGLSEDEIQMKKKEFEG